MMTIMEALKIMCQQFDDDKVLGAYIRMLTQIPSGDLDLGNEKISLSEEMSFDNLLKTTGLKRSSDG
tara:strand:- start:1298 stop:1498 length:201 start_codon:yes stop_codon:yes gene_type:complete